MDVTWVSGTAPGEPGFDNDASAYAHYWLSMLPDDVGNLPLRSAVDQTRRLSAGTQELLDRAFAR